MRHYLNEHQGLVNDASFLNRHGQGVESDLREAERWMAPTSAPGFERQLLLDVLSG